MYLYMTITTFLFTLRGFLLKVLTKREHLLVVPTENLEDVRKNITEAKQAEAESTSPGDLSLFESDVDGYTSEVENRDSIDKYHPLRSLFTIKRIDAELIAQGNRNPIFAL